MRLLSALFLALAAAPAAAQNSEVYDFPPGARAEQSGFTVAILNSSDLENFARVLGGRGRFDPAVTRTAVRGQALHTLVLVQGCRAGADGKCNVTGRFTYILPGGAVYGAIEDNDLWTQAPSADGSIQFALGPSLVVDPPDPMGEWTIRAEIRDNVRGVTVTVQTPIIVDTPPTAAAN